MQKSANMAPNGKHADMSASRKYELIDDPIFYLTIGFFAFLTTLLPGIIGQPIFLPVVQALALTIFLAAPLRRRRVDRALRVLALWLIVQLLVMIGGTVLLPAAFERAIPDGFAQRTGLITWAVTGNDLPGWVLNSPLSRIGEVVGVLFGSLLSAGLIGSWFLVRAVNQFGYVAGRMMLEAPTGLLLGLLPWRLVTFAGYAGLITLLAQPLLNNNWNPAYYVQDQRRLWQVAGLLVLLGLVLEVLLPGLWRILFSPR